MKHKKLFVFARCTQILTLTYVPSKGNVELHNQATHIRSYLKISKAIKAREEAREPYDDKMTELMKRLLSNPQLKEWIKKELEEVKDEKA